MTEPINGDKVPLPWADLRAYRAAYQRENPIPPLEAVVPALADRCQWLIWRYEPGETPEKKPRKMPYYANGKRRHGDQGSEADRAALADFATAAAAAGKRGFDGVGFAFLPGDGLIGIDLDGMIDPESGEIGELCREIVAACASYTELSPSGKGVHIICAGQTESFKSNRIGVEVFSGAQFFTFTARAWAGSALELSPLAPEVLARLRQLVDDAKGHGKTRPPAAPREPGQGGGVFGGRVRSRAESVALAEEAIGFISPDDYQDWIKVGMACKELGRSGYLIWDEWSSRSAKYAGPADTEKRWDSFNPTQVTLGALFGMAKDGGWVAPWDKASRKPVPQRGGPPPSDDVPPLGDAAPPSPPSPSADLSSDPAPAADEISTPSGAAAGGEERAAPETEWEIGLIRKKGELSSCLANADLLLKNLPEWEGVIAYDEFAEREVFRKPLPFMPNGPKSGVWEDHLDVSTAIWLQRALCTEFSDAIVGKAVGAVARANKFHPVREALNALPPWDGKPRNATWLSDFLGAEQTPYLALVGVYFIRGMISRVMAAGSKFDYCMVLEGAQGKGKSTVSRILGWHWYCDTDLDLSNKDSLLALPGHWVYEIAELGSLLKAEQQKQKSFLSRQFDKFRPPYGKRLVEVPRQNVFIGTTNEDEYLKDPTGARRFWPVRCGDNFDLEGLRAALEQMFAEALQEYREGEKCYPTPEEEEEFFKPEQMKRGMPEPFDDGLAPWVAKQYAPFSMTEAAIDCLGLGYDKLTPAVTTRIGFALKKLGCVRAPEDRLAADQSRRRLYLPPSLAKTAAGVAPLARKQEEGTYAQF